MVKHKHMYFSVGEYCATAYQIRHLCGTQDAFLFDWLVTHGDNFRFLVEPDHRLLVDGDWAVVENGIRLLDKGTGLLFQHEFKTDTLGKIDPLGVKAQLPIAREKFLYLKQKLLNALRNCHSGVLIRAENRLSDSESAKARLSQLREIFSAINPALKFVIASVRMREDVVAWDHLLVRLDQPPPTAGSDCWKGDDQSWRRLFELAELHFP